MPILSKGFSLLELLIGLMIISILVTIAYPGYQRYLQQMHRQQAILVLMQLSDQLARYHFRHHTYEGATLDNLNVSIQQNFYKMSIEQATQNTYELSAKPLFIDTECGVLGLNELHQKSISKQGSLVRCW